MGRLNILSCAILLSSLATHSVTEAQDAAQSLFQQGTRALHDEDYVTATKLLEQSLSLHPHPPTANNLATAYEGSGEFKKALELLQRLADGAFGKLEPEQLAIVLERKKKLVSRLGTLVVTVDGSSQAEVRVTGHEAPYLWQGNAISIDADPGFYVISARAEGFEGTRKSVTLSEGQTQALSLRLRELPEQVDPREPADNVRTEKDGRPKSEAPKEALQTAPPRQDDESLLESEWFWAGLAVAVAAGVVTAIAVSSSGSSGPGSPNEGYFGTVEALR